MSEASDNTNRLKCRVCKKHKSEVEFPFKHGSITERGKACEPCRELENASKRRRRVEGKENKDPLKIAEAGVPGELSWKAMLKDLERARVPRLNDHILHNTSHLSPNLVCGAVL